MAEGAPSEKPKRIAILISGRGSNMIALAEAVRDGRIPNAEIALVLSDQPTAAGLTKAREFGIETLVVERHQRTRQEYDRHLVAELAKHSVDLVCLAGFMRILSSVFIAAYRRRILNIHPSLLPLFPGLEAQKQALAHGAKISGCSVHYVDETVDGGPIIAQRSVPVREGDTIESLSARILVEEHTLYPEAVRQALNELSEE